ncbi:helix-turn-helix domain-containing protein [Prevotella communis]|uniref:helix-turn-helix domain-containing protein n=1 Tax=Prevotella communis TaxID=2913614 RepID=UPI001EDBD1B2|nr:helix-turn-helix domain-containing protein [Prevotella communis]UKK61084.1 helix-turn-helix domain-containing protein [Prevotella communis]UKK63909.1 helix-turn-helix domain-containing protein [Prevotella communis]
MDSKTFLSLTDTFWRIDHEVPFTPTAAKLYLHLLYQAAQIGFTNQLSRSDEMLAAELGMSRNTMLRAREELIGKQLLSVFSFGRGRGRNLYQVNVQDNVQGIVQVIVQNLNNKTANTPQLIVQNLNNNASSETDCKPIVQKLNNKSQSNVQKLNNNLTDENSDNIYIINKEENNINNISSESENEPFFAPLSDSLPTSQPQNAPTPPKKPHKANPQSEGEAVLPLQIDDPYDFAHFWELYDKKVGKPKAEKLYAKLSLRDRKAIFEYIPRYIASQPDKQYRKNPETFLRNRSWEDEVISASAPAASPAGTILTDNSPSKFDNDLWQRNKKA